MISFVLDYCIDKKQNPQIIRKSCCKTYHSILREKYAIPMLNIGLSPFALRNSEQAFGKEIIWLKMDQNTFLHRKLISLLKIEQVNPSKSIVFQRILKTLLMKD